MKKIIFILFIAYYSLQIAYAQQPTVEWMKRFDAFGMNDHTTDMTTDKFGNVYVTGYCATVSEGSNIFTIKYNTGGVQQWAVSYNDPGPSLDDAFACAVDSNGNIYIVGSTAINAGQTDLIVLKYNSNGVFQWIRKYIGSANGDDFAVAVAIDKFNNICVAGQSRGVSTSDDYITIKYNSNGDSLWVQRYNGPANILDWGKSVAVDDTGNVYVTGGSVGTTNFDYATVKYNTNGLQQWVSRYNGTGNGNDQARKIVVDNSGNVYVTGFQRGSGFSNNYATIKYNASGVQQWLAVFGGDPSIPFSEAYDLKADNMGNVYVTGYSYLTSNVERDYLTIKYNQAGDSVWVKRYSGPGDNLDEAFSVALDTNYNVYVTGRSIDTNNNFSFATVKYSNSGVLKWAARYPGSGVKVMIDKDNNIIVAGGNSDDFSGIDYFTIKYSDIVNINIISTGIPKTYMLHQNFPNPFNPNTIIRFSIAKRSFVQMRIYDMLGRLKEFPVNENIDPSEYELKINGANYSSGVYFYQLIADGKIIDTKKFIVLK